MAASASSTHGWGERIAKNDHGRPHKIIVGVQGAFNRD
jgi:hypothetical protein